MGICSSTPRIKPNRIFVQSLDVDHPLDQYQIDRLFCPIFGKPLHIELLSTPLLTPTPQNTLKDGNESINRNQAQISDITSIYGRQLFGSHILLPFTQPLLTTPKSPSSAPIQTPTNSVNGVSRIKHGSGKNGVKGDTKSDQKDNNARNMPKWDTKQRPSNEDLCLLLAPSSPYRLQHQLIVDHGPNEFVLNDRWYVDSPVVEKMINEGGVDDYLFISFPKERFLHNNITKMLFPMNIPLSNDSILLIESDDDVDIVGETDYGVDIRQIDDEKVEKVDNTTKNDKSVDKSQRNRTNPTSPRSIFAQSNANPTQNPNYPYYNHGLCDFGLENGSKIHSFELIPTTSITSLIPYSISSSSSDTKTSSPNGPLGFITLIVDFNDQESVRCAGGFLYEIVNLHLNNSLIDLKNIPIFLFFYNTQNLDRWAILSTQTQSQSQSDDNNINNSNTIEMTTISPKSQPISPNIPHPLSLTLYQPDESPQMTYQETLMELSITKEELDHTIALLQTGFTHFSPPKPSKIANPITSRFIETDSESEEEEDDDDNRDPLVAATLMKQITPHLIITILRLFGWSPLNIITSHFNKAPIPHDRNQAYNDMTSVIFKHFLALKPDQPRFNFTPSLLRPTQNTIPPLPRSTNGLNPRPIMYLPLPSVVHWSIGDNLITLIRNWFFKRTLGAYFINPDPQTLAQETPLPRQYTEADVSTGNIGLGFWIRQNWPVCWSNAVEDRTVVTLFDKPAPLKLILLNNNLHNNIDDYTYPTLPSYYKEIEPSDVNVINVNSNDGNGVIQSTSSSKLLSQSSSQQLTSPLNPLTRCNSQLSILSTRQRYEKVISDQYTRLLNSLYETRLFAQAQRRYKEEEMRSSQSTNNGDNHSTFGQGLNYGDNQSTIGDEQSSVITDTASSIGTDQFGGINACRTSGIDPLRGSTMSNGDQFRHSTHLYGHHTINDKNNDKNDKNNNKNISNLNHNSPHPFGKQNSLDHNNHQSLQFRPSTADQHHYNQQNGFSVPSVPQSHSHSGLQIPHVPKSLSNTSQTTTLSGSKQGATWDEYTRNSNFHHSNDHHNIVTPITPALNNPSNDTLNTTPQSTNMAMKCDGNMTVISSNTDDHRTNNNNSTHHHNNDQDNFTNNNHEDQTSHSYQNPTPTNSQSLLNHQISSSLRAPSPMPHHRLDVIRSPSPSTPHTLGSPSSPHTLGSPSSPHTLRSPSPLPQHHHLDSIRYLPSSSSSLAQLPSARMNMRTESLHGDESSRRLGDETSKLGDESSRRGHESSKLGDESPRHRPQRDTSTSTIAKRLPLVANTPSHSQQFAPVSYSDDRMSSGSIFLSQLDKNQLNYPNFDRNQNHGQLFDKNHPNYHNGSSQSIHSTPNPTFKRMSTTSSLQSKRFPGNKRLSTTVNGDKRLSTTTPHVLQKRLSTITSPNMSSQQRLSLISSPGRTPQQRMSLLATSPSMLIGIGVGTGGKRRSTLMAGGNAPTLVDPIAQAARVYGKLNPITIHPRCRPVLSLKNGRYEGPEGDEEDGDVQMNQKAEGNEVQGDLMTNEKNNQDNVQPSFPKKSNLNYFSHDTNHTKLILNTHIKIKNFLAPNGKFSLNLDKLYNKGYTRYTDDDEYITEMKEVHQNSQQFQKEQENDEKLQKMQQNNTSTRESSLINSKMKSDIAITCNLSYFDINRAKVGISYPFSYFGHKDDTFITNILPVPCYSTQLQLTQYYWWAKESGRFGDMDEVDVPAIDTDFSKQFIEKLAFFTLQHTFLPFLRYSEHHNNITPFLRPYHAYLDDIKTDCEGIEEDKGSGGKQSSQKSNEKTTVKILKNHYQEDKLEQELLLKQFFVEMPFYNIVVLYYPFQNAPSHTFDEVVLGLDAHNDDRHVSCTGFMNTMRAKKEEMEKEEEKEEEEEMQRQLLFLQQQQEQQEKEQRLNEQNEEHVDEVKEESNQEEKKQNEEEKQPGNLDTNNNNNKNQPTSSSSLINVPSNIIPNNNTNSSLSLKQQSLPPTTTATATPTTTTTATTTTTISTTTNLSPSPQHTPRSPPTTPLIPFDHIVKQRFAAMCYKEHWEEQMAALVERKGRVINPALLNDDELLSTPLTLAEAKIVHFNSYVTTIVVTREELSTAKMWVERDGVRRKFSSMWRRGLEPA